MAMESATAELINSLFDLNLDAGRVDKGREPVLQVSIFI
jgi:hypothetical protein